MDRGNKVKYRGIQIGKVDDISYYGQRRPSCDWPSMAVSCTTFPSNAGVHIASNTIFGAKSVEFIPPKDHLRRRRCGRARIWRSRRYRSKSIRCFSR